MNKRRLIAEVLYGATAHIRATKIGTRWWFKVYYGSKYMVTCDCGGAVKDRPSEMTYDEAWGGCSHIVALYSGNVTTNETAREIDEYRVSYNGGRPPYPSFVRLTQLGRSMFHPRWTVKALSP